MSYQLAAGCLVSVLNFGIHAIITGLIVVSASRISAATGDLHVFVRVAALLLVTTVVLMAGHLCEVAMWAGLYTFADVPIGNLGPFEFAFENYTAVGYGDVVAGGGWRVIGPIAALNGLLLIGWSVAIIFEVMRMAEVQVGRRAKRPA